MAEVRMSDSSLAAQAVFLLTSAAWHIPPRWAEGSGATVDNIIDAATLALNASRLLPERQIPHSDIPLIIHQTWKDTQPERWPETFRQSAEIWLSGVDKGNMAYFLWDDRGISQFIRHFEPEMESQFYALPNNVERSDVFRILVSKWIGGIVSYLLPRSRTRFESGAVTKRLTEYSTEIWTPSLLGHHPNGLPRQICSPGKTPRLELYTTPPNLSELSLV
jgi:hypothetical protein